MQPQPTLLVLAAGMGSRYGGLKQLDPMGPHGETLLDYSVHDAIQAGFSKVVFVIRRDIEEPFRKTVGKRYEGLVDIGYVFQDMDDLPDGYLCPPGRTKPWGTAHAVRAARHAVAGPFAVINADDFYGAAAYTVLAAYFARCAAAGTEPLGLVAYSLEHTLSEHGSVNRGLCRAEGGRLLSVEEVVGIERDREGVILGTDQGHREIRIDPQAPVSMNFWGFSARLFEPLERHFTGFLKFHGRELTREFYIPSFIDQMITSEDARCDLLHTDSKWFGVTYPGDKPFVQQHLLELIRGGAYPSPLHG